MSKSSRKPIMLCAGQNGRALIFGYVDSDPIPGQPVTMYDARMILYFAKECGGLFGLIAQGPKGDTRITHAVIKNTETVWQEWQEISPSAAEKIESWIVYDD